MIEAGKPRQTEHVVDASDRVFTEFLLYQTEDGEARVEVRVGGDTVWLSLSQLSELFERDRSVISRHIKNIFDEGEVPRESVVAPYATTAADGKTYQVYHRALAHCS